MARLVAVETESFALVLLELFGCHSCSVRDQCLDLAGLGGARNILVHAKALEQGN